MHARVFLKSGYISVYVAPVLLDDAYFIYVLI